jgi:hypothetical protein
MCVIIITIIIIIIIIINWNWGHSVEQLVEALFCKPEGRGFDSRWYHWNFSLAQFFRPHYGHGGKGGQCVGLTLPPSCADCLEIWEP